MNTCLICKHPCVDDLCTSHEQLYIYDSKIKGYRLKKRLRGSRYTVESYHKTEIELTKILEDKFGKGNVVTGFHPKWAVGEKGVLLEFDILIKNKNILIEYNGRQHYTHTKFFHKTRREFVEQKLRDRAKRRMAADNGYVFITFRYDEPIFKDYVLKKIEAYK